MRCDDAGALLFDDLHELTAARRYDRVQQHHRDRDDQAFDRSDERGGNTARHQLRIAGAEQRDRLEGQDHAGHGTEQTEQRCHGRDDLERALPLLELRGLLEDGLVDLELERLDVVVLVLVVDAQHAAQGVVGAWLAGTHLGLDLATGAPEIDQALQGDEQAESTQRQRDVTDDATLVDALLERRCQHQRTEQRTLGRVNRHLDRARAGLGAEQVARHGHEAARRLTVQLDQGLGFRQVTQETILIDGVEYAHAHHILLDRRTVFGDDRIGETNDLARLHHFLEEGVGQRLQLFDLGQAARLRQLGKNLTAVIDLRRHQRVVHHGLGVAGHLTNDAEHFAEVAEARAKRLGQLGQLLFVDVELRPEAVAALFSGSQGGLGPLQHLALLVACLAELLLTPLVQRVLLTAGTTHLLEKLV